MKRIREHGLTEKEWQVARLVIAGYTNGEIAEELVMSVHTVRSHLQHSMTKTNVDKRTQLALWAVANDPTPRGPHGRTEAA